MFDYPIKPLHMKKILTVIFAFFLINSAFGAYLENVPKTLYQPDGSVIYCFASGDEFHNWLHDANNYTIIKNSKTGYWVYAIKKDKKLCASDFVVGKSDPVALNLQKAVNISADEIKAKRNAFYSKLETEKKKQNVKSNKSIQTINNLVVFIRFSDEEEFTDQIAVYDTMFNSNIPTVNSMKNYFKEVSYNQLEINSTFYPTTTEEIVLSYQDPNPRSYYQPYDEITNPDGYTEQTPREHLLLKNAIDYISNQVPTNLNLNYNGDEYVDNVCFVIKGGVGEWAELLWPHRWALYSEEAYINGLRVWDYNFQLQEFFFLPNRGVGVLNHEMFHTLGAPDLYHYNTDFRNFKAIGAWDLMDRTKNPSQSMGVYMKYVYGGWITEIPEITEPGTYTLHPLSSSQNNCYKISSPNSLDEYFVLEYRKKTGVFENSLPGEGLLIYRVNNLFLGYGNSQYPDNLDELYIYRPNGIDTTTGDIDSAAFSLNSGRVTFDATSNPACLLFDGSDGGITITNITTTDSTISFCVNGNCTSKITNLKPTQLKFYPNPVSNQLFVELPEIEKFAVVKIYDICGKNIYNETLYNTSKININTSYFSNGLYTISVITEIEKYNSKFLK